MLPQDVDDLLTPREVAMIFGVRTTTIARWAREGRLASVWTPGGRRRYSRTGVRELLAAETDAERQQMIEDATRLYDQGWSIRQVAQRFDYSYSAMRSLLKKNALLRNRGGLEQPGPGREQHPRVLQPARPARTGTPDT